jgi:hypothetical protein
VSFELCYFTPFGSTCTFPVHTGSSQIAFLYTDFPVQAAFAGDGDKKMIEKLKINYDKGSPKNVSCFPHVVRRKKISNRFRLDF